MHICSCLECIAYIRVYVNICIGELCELVKLGELYEFGD